MRTCESDNPSGTILYIHGLGESGLCFEEIMAHERFSRWTHLLPDLPGYGKSPWPDPPLSLEDQADFLAEWLTAQGIGAVMVIGHSMGGVIGMILCEKHPELVKTFINIEGNVSFEDCTISSAIASVSPEDFISHELDALRNRIYLGGLRDRALRTYHAGLLMCQPRALHRNACELEEISKTQEIPTRLGNLRIPQAYILGNPRGTGAYSRALLHAAGVNWFAVEKAGHWPFIDQPDEFMDVLFGCLANTPRSSKPQQQRSILPSGDP